MKIIRQHTTERIKEAISSLLLPHRVDFYFYFLQHVDFYEIDPASVPMPTGCATVINMRLAICYCQEYIDKLDDHTLRAFIIHELFHLIHSHLDRGQGYNPKTANIAMDMIINHLIEKHHTVDSRNRQMTHMPYYIKGQTKDGWVKLDPNYKGPLIFENLYEWLVEQQQKEEQQEGGSDMAPETRDFMKQTNDGMTVDFHSLPDEVQAEIKRQLTTNAVEKAKLEARGAGNMPGEMDDILTLLLTPPKKDNMKLIKRSIGQVKGRLKQDSYRRSNRRVEGLKGVKKSSSQLNVLLDTSGSMWGRFDKVLNEIFRDGYEINLVQCDTRVSKVLKIKDKKELIKFSIAGGGGTQINPGVDYIQNPENGLSKFGSILLTDGALYEQLDFKNIQHQWLILSLGDAPIDYVNGPNVKIIEIKD